MDCFVSSVKVGVFRKRVPFTINPPVDMDRFILNSHNTSFLSVQGIDLKKDLVVLTKEDRQKVPFILEEFAGGEYYIDVRVDLKAHEEITFYLYFDEIEFHSEARVIVVPTIRLIRED